MNSKLQNILRMAAVYWRRPRFSPTGFIKAALLIFALFGVFHLLGWRSDVSVLSGTFPGGAASPTGAIIRGLFYVIFYLATVLIVPIFLIASGIFYTAERWILCFSKITSTIGESTLHDRERWKEK